MNASKENAEKALEHANALSVSGIDNVTHIAFIREFLGAAVKRLPREKAINDDKARRGAKNKKEASK
jgi:hypothetical protein